MSAREREVLRRVAAGHSNQAIARQLFLSASTVNYHLTSVLNKLTVDTRAQTAAVAAQLGTGSFQATHATPSPLFQECSHSCELNATQRVSGGC